jgi:hypothetical protein
MRIFQWYSTDNERGSHNQNGNRSDRMPPGGCFPPCSLLFLESVRFRRNHQLRGGVFATLVSPRQSMDAGGGGCRHVCASILFGGGDFWSDDATR